ncbi:MAG: thiamine diphosphokinase [Marinifilaceae bacterium]|jgi:nicotinamide mononucleotide transporter|nr:thiamine diphosphokinase [Marinifilaceae bacterium]
MEYLEIIGTIVGLIYLYLEYKANIYVWLAGFIMPAIYIKVYYDAGLYADMGINVYYLIAAVYGWIIWKRLKDNKSKTEDTNSDIKFMPNKYLVPLSVISVAIFGIIGFILTKYTNSNVPWLDSLTTTLSIVAMWQLAHKYIEQWVLWFIIDAVSCGLYIYKDLPFTSGLYALYSVIAIIGYYKWYNMNLISQEKSISNENIYINQIKKFSTLIICNGEFPKNNISKELIKNAEKIICCDGAADIAIENKIIPNIIIGDGDSISEQVQKNYSNRFIHIKDQENNDLSKAVNYCQEQNIENIAILGLTGKRDDHTIANISLLNTYKSNIISVTDYGMFVTCKDNSKLSTYKGQQISIINYNATGLDSNDLKYPIYDFKETWQGTLNEAIKSKIEIKAKGKYLVYLNF